MNDVGQKDYRTMLLQLSARSQIKKSKNFNQQKKIQQKMAEKFNRQHQKEMDAAYEEKVKRAEAYWAPRDKIDAKFQNKQQKKLRPSGPSKKQLKKELEDEDNKLIF